jgi:hypothetical protein
MTMMILIHCSPSTLLELKFAGQRDIYIYREREREKQAAGQASYFGDFFAIILNPPPHTHTNKYT